MAKRANVRQGRSKKGKYILFGVEVLIILVMVLVLFKVMSSDALEGPKVTYMDQEEAKVPSQVQEQKEEGGTMHGYMNIALFGVDATTDKQLFGGSRSDCIMIANINLDTGDIKLVSVYRDTYMNAGEDAYGNKDTYSKCNSAYSWGGAKQAVQMLNENLDMDIVDFVAVSYKGLSKVIDGLGGIYVDVDSEELLHINNYQIGVAEVLKTDYTRVENPGYQLLNGIQAAAYCRIRQTNGSDFQRTARQREVLKAIEAQAKQLDLVTLTKVFNDCIGDVYTTIDSKDILDLLENIANYRITDEAGFPDETMRTAGNLGAKGLCVIPADLESNVVWLHQYLFGDDDYAVTETVKERSEKIKRDTAPYLESN